MAIALTDEQKLQKRQQDAINKDMQKRQTVTNFPTNTQPGQEVPLMQQAKPPVIPQASTPTGNPNLQQAQQQAAAGFQSENQNRLQQMTGTLLQDPSMGRNYDAEKEATMAKFDRERSQSLESFRRATGGIAGSSDRQEELLRRFASGAFEKAQLGSQLETNQAEQRRKDLLTAFDVGQKQVGQESQLYQNQLQNLLQSSEGQRGFDEMNSREKIAFAEMANQRNIQLNDQQFKGVQQALAQEHAMALQSNDINASRSALERDLAFRENQSRLGREFTEQQSSLDRTLKKSLAYIDIEGNKSLAELRAKLDMDQLLTSQDFQEAQNALNRALEKEMQGTDIEAKKNLFDAQNEFDLLKQKSQQEWLKSERIATQIYNTDERIDEQSHQKALQYLEFQNNKELADKNIAGQITIAEMQGDLQLKMQTQDMQQQEKMAYLKSQLQEASNSKDFERQKTLMKMQTMEEIKVLQQQNNFAQSMAVINTNLQKSLNNNDFNNAQILQEMKFSQELQLQMNDNIIKQAQLDLQEKGFNLDSIFQAIENGQMSPEASMEYLKQNLPPEVANSIKPPDPYAVQKAIKEDYFNQQLQYSLTHPGSALNDAQGNFIGLKPEAQTGFNDFVNQLYGNEQAIDQMVAQITNKSSSGSSSGPVGPGPSPGPKPGPEPGPIGPGPI